jgi:hypothetical protein
VICNACGNQEAYRLRVSESGQSCCDHCGNLGNYTHPDVFFSGAYLDPHLVDVNKPEQKNGVWIESRRQKAEIMKRLGFRELGDKRHGSRLEDKSMWRAQKERGLL